MHVLQINWYLYLYIDNPNTNNEYDNKAYDHLRKRLSRINITQREYEKKTRFVLMKAMKSLKYYYHYHYYHHY